MAGEIEIIDGVEYHKYTAKELCEMIKGLPTTTVTDSAGGGG